MPIVKDPNKKLNKEVKYNNLSVKREYWLSDDGLLLLKAWSRDGLSQGQIAEKMGVNISTMLRWREKYPEVDKALSEGKEIVDYKVENALLKSALGFTTKEIKVTLGKKIINGETFEVLKETTTREVAPNVQAAMFWLNNRKYAEWKRNRDKVEMGEEKDQTVEIKIIKGKNSDLGDEVNEEVTIKKRKKPVDLDKKSKEKDLNDWSDWDGEEFED